MGYPNIEYVIRPKYIGIGMFQPIIDQNKRLRHVTVTTSNVQNSVVISVREKLAVCDFTNLPYMDMNWQSLYMYGYFVTSLVAYYSRADINQ